jgi:hypothetical protein
LVFLGVLNSFFSTLLRAFDEVVAYYR